MATKNDTGQVKEKTGQEKVQFEKEIKEMFELFDKNKDKSISVDEMGKALRAMGFNMTHKQIKTAIKQIDANKNGKVEFGEFRNFMLRQYKEQDGDEDQQKQIRQAFKVFDRDGNGYIDKKELRRALKSLGEPLSESELSMMMSDADINGDGKIDYEEFVRMWTQKTAIL